MIESVKMIKDGIIRFSGDSYIWILYLAALMILIWKKRKQDKDLFLFPLLMTMLTVLNPLFANIFVKLFGFETRYHRLLWMIVYFIVIAYGMVSLIEQMKKTWKKIVVSVVCAVLIIILGEPCFYGQMYNYKAAENAYFTSDEILDLAVLLHSEGKSEPLVLYSGWLINNYRTYDPSVKSFLTRKAYENFTSYTEEEMLGKTNISKYLKALAAVFIYQDTESVSTVAFKTIVEAYGIDYIVSKKGSVISQYLEKTGFSVLGVTERMIVWKV